jgi:L-asparaginase
MDNTQVLRGVVNNSAYAAGAWLPSVGALSPADMTSTASFVKLMILLASAAHQSWNATNVKRLMQLSLLGEMMNVSRLDSRGNATLKAGQLLSALDGSAILINDPVRGPVLADSNGATLWMAVSSPSPGDMPGRLIMQNDGNLVFYSRDNAAMWATNTGDPGSSMLILGGSTADTTLSLSVYNYSARVVSATLFAQTGERAHAARAGA